MMHSKRSLDAMRHYFSIIWSDLSLHGELRGPKKLGHDWARECHDIHGYTTEELQEAIFVLDPLLTSTLKEGLYAGWPFGGGWKENQMILTDDTVIADSEEVAAELEVIADELDGEVLWGEEYAKEICVVKEHVERLTAALRILKRMRDDGSAT